MTTMRQLKRLESVSRSPIYSHFSETLSGRSTIKAYGAEKRFVKVSDHRVDVNTSLNYARIAINRWLAIRLAALGAFCVFVSALICVLQRGPLSPSDAGLRISYARPVTECR